MGLWSHARRVAVSRCTYTLRTCMKDQHKLEPRLMHACGTQAVEYTLKHISVSSPAPPIGTCKGAMVWLKNCRSQHMVKARRSMCWTSVPILLQGVVFNDHVAIIVCEEKSYTQRSASIFFVFWRRGWLCGGPYAMKCCVAASAAVCRNRVRHTSKIRCFEDVGQKRPSRSLRRAHLRRCRCGDQ